MQTNAKRARLLIAMGLLAVPLAAAGVAYACTALSTASITPSAATSGSTVTVNGKGFIAHDPSDARTSPAVIRLDSMNGLVLGTASPAGGPAGGSFSVEVTVPEVAPGEHVLVVTQNGTNGAPAYGTPARQAFTVLAPPPPPAAAPTTPLGTSPVAVQQLPPAVTQTPAQSSAAQRRAALVRALRSCNRRFASSRARTRAGKRRLASRRSACRRSATRRLS